MSGIDHLIDPSKFTIFTKTSCPYCDRVKMLLDDENEPYMTVLSDSYLVDPVTKESFLKDIERHAGKPFRTFPMVFSHGRFIGGFAETSRYIDRIKAFSAESGF